MSNSSLKLLLLCSFFDGLHFIAIDNEIVKGGVPEVACFRNGFQLQINTRNVFIGKLYIRGMYNNPSCSHMYSGKNKKPNLIISYEDCIHKRVATKSPSGMMYTVDVVAQFHPFFTTKTDQGFVIMCMYREGSNTVVSNQGIKGNVADRHGEYTDSAGNPADVRIDRVSYAPVMPKCSYSIVSGSPQGKPIAYAKVGQKVFHRWECEPGADGQFHGLQVHSCTASDSRQNTIKLLDDRGCTLDPISMPTPTYSHNLTVAVAEVWAFKFAESLQISFACSINLCLRMNDRCRGITPPQCDGNSGNSEDYGTSNNNNNNNNNGGNHGNRVNSPGIQPATTFIGGSSNTNDYQIESISQNSGYSSNSNSNSEEHSGTVNSGSQMYFPPGYSQIDTAGRAGYLLSNVTGKPSDSSLPLPKNTLLSRGLSFGKDNLKLKKTIKDHGIIKNGKEDSLSAEFFAEFLQETSRENRKRETKIVDGSNPNHIPFSRPKIDFDQDNQDDEELKSYLASKSQSKSSGNNPASGREIKNSYWLEKTKDGKIILKSEPHRDSHGRGKRTLSEDRNQNISLLNDLTRMEFVVFDAEDDTPVSESPMSEEFDSKESMGVCLSIVSTIHISLAVVVVFTSLSALLFYFYLQTQRAELRKKKRLAMVPKITPGSHKSFLTDLINLESKSRGEVKEPELILTDQYFSRDIPCSFIDK